MSGQTSVDLRITNATPGLIADINIAEVISAAAETVPPIEIEFGVIVQRGTDPDDQAIIGGTPATGILGVTVRSTGIEAFNVGSTSLGYDEGDAMAIMQSGYIFVACPSGASPGDPVIFDDVTGVIDAGVAGVGSTTIDNAEWMETVLAGGFGKIRIDSVSSLTAGV